VSGESERFAMVLDLYAFATAQMRANLRRLHPELDDGERERLLEEWLLSRPSAPDGDAVGRRRRA
jgi:hypothetical protein